MRKWDIAKDLADRSACPASFSRLIIAFQFRFAADNLASVFAASLSAATLPTAGETAVSVVVPTLATICATSPALSPVLTVPAFSAP